MSGEEFHAFVEDIKSAQVVYEPLVLHEGRILEGRNRWRAIQACRRSGVEPRYKFVRWRSVNGETPLDFVISMNVKRRMLNESQRAMVAARIANLRDGQTKRAVPNGTAGVSLEDAAKMLNVGRRSVARARAVTEQGIDELVDLVDAGRVPVSVAEDIANQTRAIQRRAVRLAARSRTEKALRDKVQRLAMEHQRKQELKKAEKLGKEWNIITGDFRRIRRIEDESVDLVFVDPVYPPHAPISLYDDLGKWAARVLKPGGSLVTYICVQEMLNAGDMLRKHLRYHWSIAVICDGSQTATVNRINCRFKPLLWFSKGKPRINRTWMLTDALPSRRQKDHHEWQQSTVECEAMIQAVTKPGDLVVDPMVGSGTTVLTALKLGRQAIGIEKCSKTAALARKRIADACDQRASE